MVDLSKSSSVVAPATYVESRLRKQRFDTPEAAEYLLEVHGVSVAHATLNKLRSVGGGPQFLKFGRSVIYQREALDSWVAEKLGRPLASTSDVDGAK